jgi:hypothetical protein
MAAGEGTGPTKPPSPRNSNDLPPWRSLLEHVVAQLVTVEEVGHTQFVIDAYSPETGERFTRWVGIADRLKSYALHAGAA